MEISTFDIKCRVSTFPEIMAHMELKKELFTEKQIGISAFLGGPVPPGILIYKNLIRVNKEKEAYATLGATFILTVALVYILIAIPDNLIDKVPSQLVSSVIGLIFWGLYRFLLSDIVKKELESGSISGSNWSVAGITIIGVLLYLSIALVVAFSQPPFSGEKMSFDNNEIYFDENTSSADVKKLADKLFDVGFFSSEYPNAVKLETWSSKYVVIFSITEDYWTDQEIINELTSLKWLLEAEFGKDVTITMEDFELNGKRITKEI